MILKFTPPPKEYEATLTKYLISEYMSDIKDEYFGRINLDPDNNYYFEADYECWELDELEQIVKFMKGLPC